MKKRILFSVLFCCAFNFAFSQNEIYEKGYFTDKNNKKIECLIKNMDWDKNPAEFEYKTDENSQSKIISANNIQEVSVGQEYKFISANVKIDKSNDKTESAASVKTLNLVDENLLLRVRVEGKAALYSFKTDNYLRFFYSMDSGPITQLSYKMYFDKDLDGYRKNETYKQELLNSLKCSQVTENDIERLDYTDTRLKNLFIKYDNCSNSLTDKFEKKRNYKTFQLYAVAGLGFSKASVDFPAAAYSADFSTKAKFKIGLQLEVNLSNKLKRWSVLFESVYQKYDNTSTYGTPHPIDTEIDYKSLDFSFGLRRYFVVNPKSMLFADGYYTFAFAKNSKVTQADLDISNSLNGSLGLGYLYNNKYSVEFRYEFQRNLFVNHNGVDSKFSTVGLVLGYKLL